MIHGRTIHGLECWRGEGDDGHEHVQFIAIDTEPGHVARADCPCHPKVDTLLYDGERFEMIAHQWLNERLQLASRAVQGGMN